MQRAAGRSPDGVTWQQIAAYVPRDHSPVVLGAPNVPFQTRSVRSLAVAPRSLVRGYPKRVPDQHLWDTGLAAQDCASRQEWRPLSEPVDIELAARHEFDGHSRSAYLD